MGSIPVAGAKNTDGFAVGIFGTRIRQAEVPSPYAQFTPDSFIHNMFTL